MKKRFLNFLDLVNHLPIPETVLRDAREYANYNEFGVGFDLVIQYLYENDIRIDNGIYVVATALAKDMLLPESEYGFIKKLITPLA